MDSEDKLYLERAENEIILAKTNLDISLSNELKNILKIQNNRTFFNDVITQCYYSIFYTAKAYLLSRNIETEGSRRAQKDLWMVWKICCIWKIRQTNAGYL